MYYAVRHGWFRGVFINKNTALRAVANHPNPKMQEFFSRQIADEYVYRAAPARRVAYTDGSYRRRSDSAGFGVFFCDRKCMSGVVPVLNPTSQKAEAYAALVALCATDGDIEIRTDSIELVFHLTMRFRRNHLYQAIDQQTKGRTVIWTYVKAHHGYFGNECADELARCGHDRARVRVRPRLWRSTKKTYLEALIS